MSTPVHVRLRELRSRESEGPQINFCAKGKHRPSVLLTLHAKHQLLLLLFLLLLYSLLNREFLGQM